MVDEERLDVGPAEDDAPQRARRDDVRDRRLTEQHADLAEEVTAGKGRALLAVGDDVGLAVEDHEEAGAGQALPEDPRVLREERLLETAGDAHQLRARQVDEDRHPGDRVGDFVAGRHRALQDTRTSCCPPGTPQPRNSAPGRREARAVSEQLAVTS
jgi:hypothetical protein